MRSPPGATGPKTEGTVRRLRETACPQRLLASPCLGAAAVTLSVLSAALFGFVGIGRGGGAPFGFDGEFLAVAGAMWLHGTSPYAAHAFEAAAHAMGVSPALGAAGFAYPPTAAPLAMVLGAMPLRAGTVLLGAMNVLAAVAVIGLTLRLLPPRTSSRPEVRAFAAVAVLASPFVQHVFWMGQTTLLALASLLAGWYWGVLRGRSVLGGVLLALSTLKPQLVVFSLAWIVLEGQWGLALAAACAAFVLGLPAFFASGGVVPAAIDWVHALQRYASGPVQTISFAHVFGLRSLMAMSGLRQTWVTSAAVASLAVASLAALWIGRDRTRANSGELPLVALTLTLSALLVYAHDYDLAAISTLLVCAWVATAERPVLAWALVFGTGVLFVPQRLLRGLGAVTVHPWALHWRELVVVAVAAPLLVRSVRTTSATHLPSAPPPDESPGRGPFGTASVSEP